jgi:multiple sugar transport system substrate-binding protein
MSANKPRFGRRRIAASVAALVSAGLLSGLLAGCAPGGGAAAAPSASVDANKPVTLTWWDYYAPGPGPDALAKEFAAYEKSHTNVTIKRRFVQYDAMKQTLLQSAGAKTLPDIVVINSPDQQQFAQLGVAEDLTSEVKQWGQLDKYPKGAVQSASYEGKVYGLPLTVNDLALFYNKAMFEKAGITPPTTWAELQDDAKKLTSNGTYGLAYSAINNQQAVFQWLPTLWQAGGDLTNLTSPQSVKALNYWSGLMSDGSVSKEALSWDQTQVEVEFSQGRAAMMVNGPWQIPTLASATPNLQYGVVPLPKGSKAATALGGENAMIVKGPHAAASWDLLKWLQDPKRVEALAKGTGSLPTRTDAKPFSDSDAIKVFTQQLEVGRPRAYGSNYNQIADAVVTALQSTLSGASSAEDALSTAKDAVTPLLPKKG